MRIKTIKLYQVDLPFEKIYHLSGGRSWKGLNTTIVSIETEDGLVGWGESCPWGRNYLPGYPEGARAGLEVLAPRLIGANAHEIARINHLMDAELAGHPYVKTGLDTACWDLLGKKTGYGVSELLGGIFNPTFPIAFGVPVDQPEHMLASFQNHQNKGIRNFSIKVSGEPDHDIPLIRSIIEARKEGDRFLVDANRGYSVSQALSVDARTRDLDYVFEQPCGTIAECARVSGKTNRALALDESVADMSVVLSAIKEDVAEVINIKPGKVGGITKAKRIMELCHEAGLTCLVQEVGGSDIANAAMFHLAAATPVKTLHSCWDLREVATVATADGLLPMKDGRCSAPKGPGLGITPRMEVLGAATAVFP